MSRGYGQRQKQLLAAVKRMKPGEQMRLVDLLNGSASADEWDSARRAARQLEGQGLLRLDGVRRELVVRPPLDPQKSDKFRVAKTPVSDAYRGPEYQDTPTQSKGRNNGLSVGLVEDKLWTSRGVIEELGEADRWDDLARHHRWFSGYLEEASKRRRQRRPQPLAKATQYLGELE